jgi:teichuronic acid biosynthesis glycosyltransferase TuaG
MEKNELISIITPAYNAADFIAQTIQSVQAQTYTNWEMLIVDDGSTDSTEQVIKQFANADARVKYIYQDNGRQGKARNNAIRQAQGNYLAFLDADDVWVENKLETQLSFIKTQQADLIFSDAYYFSDKLTSETSMQIKTTTYQGEQGLKAFLIANRIPILTVFCRKELIVNLGGFTEDRRIQNAEDYHLWLKLLMHGKKLVAQDAVLAYYRVHENAATHKDRSAIMQVLHAITDLRNHFPKFAPLIDANIPVRIDTYLYNHIVTCPHKLSELLHIRNAYTTEQLNINRWLKQYNLLGYKVWRKLFFMFNKTYHQ